MKKNFVNVITMMRYFVWTWSLLLVMQNVAGQERCTTPGVLQGTCLNIINNFKECPAIINVLRKPRPLQQSDLDFLKMSQCGFDGEDPKFCCKKELEEDHVYDVSDHPNLRLLDNDKCGLTSYRKPVRCYSNYEDMYKELAENHGSIPEFDNPIEQFLYENICIIERNIYRPLIFYGSGTELFSFPWMALIAFITSAQYPEFRCGGSLINKRYVLTAAHCVTMLPEGFTLFGVRLGEQDLTTEIDCPSGASVPNAFCASKYQDFGVETIHFHPKYSKAKLQDDIALIRLDKDVNFTANNVKPICLPIKSIKSYIPTELTVTGWGATENGTRSSRLLQAKLSIIPFDNCTKSYRTKNIVISRKQTCAGGKNRKDSCSGDSGGPLQASALYYSEVRNVQYGIVSYGLGTCGTIGFPGIYTNVSYYLKWILDTMKA